MLLLIPRPLEKHELEKKIREELEYVCEVLRERNGKTIKGDEYETGENCYYRGVLFGDFILGVFTFFPPVIRSRKTGNRIFVTTDKEEAVTYANYYAKNERITKRFEEEQRKIGYKIPAGGAFLMEIPEDEVKKVPRTYTELHLPGILVEGKEGAIHPWYLTDNCKKYILKELGLSKDSFLYEVLFTEQPF